MSYPLGAKADAEQLCKHWGTAGTRSTRAHSQHERPKRGYVMKKIYSVSAEDLIRWRPVPGLAPTSIASAAPALRCALRESHPSTGIETGRQRQAAVKPSQPMSKMERKIGERQNRAATDSLHLQPTRKQLNNRPRAAEIGGHTDASFTPPTVPPPRVTSLSPPPFHPRSLFADRSVRNRSRQRLISNFSVLVDGRPDRTPAAFGSKDKVPEARGERAQSCLRPTPLLPGL